MPTAKPSLPTGWIDQSGCDIAEFRRIVETPTDIGDYPHAQAVETDIVVYDAGLLVGATRTGSDRHAVQAELAEALLNGPGVVAMRNAFDPSIVDRASEVFEELLVAEREAGKVRGDHYAPPGANERLWDALGKLAMRSPEVFADYYANPLLPLVAEAWLGPGYQLTSAVNIVNPGGAAQAIHCDYHLGFQTNEQASAFPAHVHLLSQTLTLQGAIAHCDMPVESGPTLYIPHSQKYRFGYLAWRLPEFVEYASAHHAQPALSKGDAIFFNPAVFHAAGHNRTTDHPRMANLLQISSPFGRAMESLDRDAMVNAIYPVLRVRRREGADAEALKAVIASCAEGYPFPTNLDRDVPVDSLTPTPPAEIVWRALLEDWSPDAVATELALASERRQAYPWPSPASTVA
jgi:ectoine hydroxylase-related dioxygenase (phytanoyl-CoA dioxygenase family)